MNIVLKAAIGATVIVGGLLLTAFLLVGLHRVWESHAEVFVLSYNSKELPPLEIEPDEPEKPPIIDPTKPSIDC